MVDQNSNEGMSDDELERELRGLLDVEPSSDFVARVRADVDARSIAAGPWLTGRWIAVAAAFIVAIAGVALWLGHPSPAAVARQSSALPSRVIVETPPVVEAPPVRSDAAAKPFRSQPLPEVLVSPDESATLLRLLMAARDARVEPSASPADDAALNPPIPIVIEEITVAPLVTADLESGAQQ